MKRLLPIILTALALALAACGGSPAPTPQTATPEAAAGPAISAQQKLAVGTLRLSGSQAVTQLQAFKLLPLWEQVRDLSLAAGPAGDTDTQIKLDELTAEISAAMTPDQLKAIESLSITASSTFTTMQGLGFFTGGRQGGQDGAAAQGGIAPGDRQPPQGMPQGGFQGRGQGGQPPTGGQAPGGGQGFQPPADGRVFTDTQRMDRAGGRGMFLSTELYDAVIQLLVKTAG